MQRQFFRRHLRLRLFDYRSNHAYFVTIVTGGRACVFGSVEAGEFLPSRRGLITAECWIDIPRHHPFVELDAFVVMPNHVHGILLFVGNDAADVAATPASPRADGGSGPLSHSLGAVIGSFKSAVSRTISRLRPGAAERLWQPNYYEHVIRDDGSLQAIREYILTNPQRWDRDAENPTGDASDDVRRFVTLLDIESPARQATQASQLRSSNGR
jgi:REP element-mobilizing transposase RayT